MDENKINILYKNIDSHEEIDEEREKELENNLKENIVALYLVMDNFEDPLKDRMQERVIEVKEYIELLKKRAERGKNGKKI